MSLLMDALRKAEEAKKKAALKAKSEEAAAAGAEDQQATPAPVETPEEEPSQNVELSMADMEDVPARSAVPNLETPLEFEDEEDYVLPSSVGSPVTATEDEEPQTGEDSKGGEAPFELQSRDEPTEPAPAPPTAESDQAAGGEADESFETWAASAKQLDDGVDDSEDMPKPSTAPDAERPSNYGAESIGLDDFEDALDQDEDPVQPAPEVAKPSIPIPDTSALDSLEDEEPDHAASGHAEEQAAPVAEVESATVDATRARLAEERDSRTRERLDGARQAQEARAALSVKQQGRPEEPRRRSARNVFAAKKSPATSRRKMQLAAAGGLAVLLFFMGSYFYISINQESAFNIPPGSYVASEFVDDGNAVEAEPQPATIEVDPGQATVEEPPAAITDAPGLGSLDVAADVTTAPTLQELLAEPELVPPAPAPAPAQSAADIQPETLEQELPAAETLAATTDDDPAETAVAERATDDAIAATAAEDTVAEASPANAEPTNLISFRRQQSGTSVDPNLDSAYAAYQRGALTEAEALYRRVLAGDPRQRDALLGLATIAARAGNSAEALDLYSRLLARNPRDPIARAGLMELLPAASPATREADLKRLLNEYPDVAALSYAHGNFLASNQRWSEAQQAYFRALQLAKTDAAVSGRVNPDYAFNLAVSLEHLSQREPAQTYYREALDFAADHPAGFDLDAVRTRLASLAGSSSDE